MKPSLCARYDALQLQYGDPHYHAAYAGGCAQKPRFALVFMNPTARNLATAPDWQGGRYQWVGSKPIWQFLTRCGLFDPALNATIQKMTPAAWTPAFAEAVYATIARYGVYITNLAKCTQVDARPLPDQVFHAYRDLLLEELDDVQPQKVILFGNQVASITLGQKISVNAARKIKYQLKTPHHTLAAYAVHYPVGNNTHNAPKAQEDLLWLQQPAAL